MSWLPPYITMGDVVTYWVVMILGMGVYLVVGRK